VRSPAGGRPADEPLGERDHPGVLRDPELAQVVERLAEVLGGDGEEDEVGSRELVLAGRQRPDLQLVRELDAGQVALVAPRRGELGHLLDGPGEQRGANAGTNEQDGHGGAERSRAHHGGAAWMLPRVADGGKLYGARPRLAAQVAW
jgi:hypothetical protein